MALLPALRLRGSRASTTAVGIRGHGHLDGLVLSAKWLLHRRSEISSLVAPLEASTLARIIWAPFCNFAHCVSATHPLAKQVLKVSIRKHSRPDVFYRTNDTHYRQSSILYSSSSSCSSSSSMLSRSSAARSNSRLSAASSISSRICSIKSSFWSSDRYSTTGSATSVESWSGLP